MLAAGWGASGGERCTLPSYPPKLPSTPAPLQGGLRKACPSTTGGWSHWGTPTTGSGVPLSCAHPGSHCLSSLSSPPRPFLAPKHVVCPPPPTESWQRLSPWRRAQEPPSFPPAPCPGGGGDGQWRRRQGGLAQWVSRYRWRNRSSPTARFRKGLTGAADAGEEEEARGEEGPGPLTCPPSLPHLRPAGRLGQVLGSVGNLGREPEAAGVQGLVPLVPWKSWHAAHGEPPLQGFPPTHHESGGRPSTAEEPKAGRRTVRELPGPTFVATGRSSGTATPPGLQQHLPTSGVHQAPPLTPVLTLL